MLKRITSIVISLHLLFMVMLLFGQNRSHSPERKHVKVRTVQVAAATHKPTVSTRTPTKSTSTQATKQSSPPAKKPTTTANKTPPAKKPPTTTASPPAKKPFVVDKDKPAPAKKPEPPALPWEEIDQQLAKIEKKTYTQESCKPQVPEIFQETVDPTALLVGFLHDTLHLPEIGEVKVELTVSKEGVVTDVVVISSESEKNKHYLQTQLPKLKLPLEFGQGKTWTLTFSNEI